MDVPHVKREDYQLIDINDGYLSLMNDGGDIREDLRIPDGDMGASLRADHENGRELLVIIQFNSSIFVFVCQINMLVNTPPLLSRLL